MHNTGGPHKFSRERTPGIQKKGLFLELFIRPGFPVQGTADCSDNNNENQDYEPERQQWAGTGGC